MAQHFDMDAWNARRHYPFKETRSSGRSKSFMEIPQLLEQQQKFYNEFLQSDVAPDERRHAGLQAVLKETFPIVSYDGNTKLEFISYDLGVPRRTVDDCTQLKLTYGRPLKIRIRLVRKEEQVEADVYLGNIPVMIGGGEFIINGAERVIVSQIRRSPGVDFGEEIHPSGKRLHTCRIIPERGSWIQVEVTAKDTLVIRIDNSSKMPATTFLRALDEKFGTTEAIVKAFHPDAVKQVDLKKETTERLSETYLVANPLAGLMEPEPVKPSRSKNSDEPKPLKLPLKLRPEAVDYLVSKLEEAGKSTKVTVLEGVHDELLIHTLQEDPIEGHQNAIMELYRRMRPGNPPHKDKAVELFNEMFKNPQRYNFGNIGRFRINRKFGMELPRVSEDIPTDQLTISGDDYFRILNYITMLRADKGMLDDIDHLANRRVRTINDLVTEEFRKGMLKLKRNIREKISMKDADQITPQTLINSQTVSSAIEYFFARGELSQVVDQTNPLAQLTHERRLSALGPGGLNRKRAGFKERDVHPSHYGRICPIETPEGANIGLIVSMAIFSEIDAFGFIVTPYVEVKDGKVTSEVLWLRADEEQKHYIAAADLEYEHETGVIKSKTCVARHQENFILTSAAKVTLLDIAPKQLVGVAASLVPFLEHDDTTRALMGANMQRQAVPLLVPEPPLVGTGMEEIVALNSGMMQYAQEAGTVTYADSQKVTIKSAKGEAEYPLRKYHGLNDRSCLNQKPLVKNGDKVRKGQILTEGAATRDGILALGRNVTVAFLSYEGYNFEDAILVSRRLIEEDVFTSIHIEEFTCEVRETKLGREEITRDIPNVSESMLRNLDDKGLIRVGTRVRPGDILVGKIAPKSKSELSSEEKLLYAIFGRAGEDVKNDSLEVKPGCEGYVIKVEHFRRAPQIEDSGAARKEVKRLETEYNDQIAAIIREKFAQLQELVGAKLMHKVTGEVIKVDKIEDFEQLTKVDDQLSVDDLEMHSNTRRKARSLAQEYKVRRELLEVQRDRIVAHIKHGDELATGVMEMVKVYVAIKRRLSVGDKMAGRHGNKGVVSCILPVEDMPYMPDGRSVDIILNPLGIPSRMNFGQVLEVHLGWAASENKFRAVTPVFDGWSEETIRKELKSAGLPEDGKIELFDGRTGERLDQKVTVGVMYMLKLHHLVSDKIHARATGPYSLITQQPLGGKARSGGQRFGEMEVWALEAYGAASVLQELLTVKSDDVEGRTKIYESMVRGENKIEAGTPVSFDVLCNEIRGLALNVQIQGSQPGAPTNEPGQAPRSTTN
ncbi:MAG: DNA-directed RNA polymerase subunit beta [Planctomycetota bacterium]